MAKPRKDIVFPDFDLDETDLGGLLEWQEPDNTAQVWFGWSVMVSGKEVKTCGLHPRDLKKHKQMHGSLSNKMLDDVIDNDVFFSKNI